MSSTCIYKEIKRDKQIWKFCFYGLFKNLRFFEPYLLIYLLGMGLNLFQIGLLFSIREIFTCIFEIPSGIFADNYGKKKELMICFSFYIISFVLFFIGLNFMIFAMAMAFFGLGDAFRSGTHKAIIYSYLEKKQWFKYKTFVYGRTRSFSLIGSAVSAFLSIIFILNISHLRTLFLFCIVPYILDFILIYTYPNDCVKESSRSFKIKDFFILSISQIRNIFNNKQLLKVLSSSSVFDSTFKVIKDYIQPIIQNLVLLNISLAFFNSTAEDTSKIYLGIIYGIIYLFSSFASKHVHHLTKYTKSLNLMNIFFDIMGLICIALFLSIKYNSIILIMILFLLLYLLKNARRPLFVDVCGDIMDKSQRATVLSGESQLTSLFTIILAPFFGFIADNFSLHILFLFIGIFLLILNRFINIKSINENTGQSKAL